MVRTIENKFHNIHFANSWKQGIWDDFIDLHTEFIINADETKCISLDSTAMFVYIFINLYYKLLEGKPSEKELLSWKSYIIDNHNDIIECVVEAILEKLGLIRACRTFGAVLVDTYGVNASSFLLPLDELDRRYEVKLVNAILTKSKQRNLKKFFWLSPWDILLSLPKLIKNNL